MGSVLGIDASSSAIGLAIVDDGGQLGWYETYIPAKSTDAGALFKSVYDTQVYIRKLIRKEDPIAAVIEMDSVSFNMNSVRKICYFESACMVAVAAYKLAAFQVRPTTARKAVLGKGNLKKDVVHQEMEKMYGEVFTYDEADAIVCALYGLEQLR